MCMCTKDQVSRGEIGEKLNLNFLQFYQAEIPFGAKHPGTETFQPQTSGLQLCGLVCFSDCIKKQLRAKEDAGCACGLAMGCCSGG